MQVNVHQAKSQLSRLLQLVEEGERVIITRHGQPVAELVPARQKGFPFGAARREPLVPAGDEWWQPMTDAEAEPEQATIPKEIRERFGSGPETEMEFSVVEGSIVLRKTPSKLDLAKWKGRCAQSFKKLGYSSVDKFIEDVRGR